MKARALALLALIGCVCAISVAPADARTARTPRPTISVDKTAVLESEPVVLSGTAKGRQPLYRKVGTRGRWHRIATVRDRYRSTVRPQPRTITYYRVGTSRTVHVTSTGCTTLPKQGTTVTGWFNARGASSGLATKWGRLICSAARGSTIRLALFFIWAGRYTDSLVHLLAYVARYRKVHVRVLVQRTTYNDKPASNPKSWSRLKKSLSFARLSYCYHACTVPDEGAEMHYKFMTVSRTVWGRSAMVESTLNWSPQQFGKQYGSAVFFHNEPKLYAAFTRAYDLSARKAHLSDAERTSRVWTATSPTVAYVFDPSSSAADPISNELTTLRCRKGDRISVVNANVTRGRLVRQLDRLQDEGCTVRVITQGLWHANGVRYSIRHMKAHDKYVLVHADDAEGRPVDEVISGSENYRPGTMLHSQDQLVRVRTSSVVRSFTTWFTHEWSVST